MRGSQEESPATVRVERTEGDFPHVRRPSVWLACCTTTSCCLTFLVGAGGGLVGVIMGFVKGATASRRSTYSTGRNFAVGFGQSVGWALLYGILGLFAGAAIGFGLDNLMMAF